jgi:hypothetical protein
MQTQAAVRLKDNYNMNKTLLIIFGGLLVIGLVFGRFIGRLLVNKVDNKDTRTNKGVDYAAKYVANCDTIKLLMKNFKDSAQYFKVEGKFNASADDNTAYINKHQLKFYDEAHHKYFEILYFFSNNSNFDQVFGVYASSNLDKTGTAIIGVVNKDELADTNYGTSQKPVPVLYFYSAETGHSYFYTLTSQTNKPFKGTEDQFKDWMLNYNASHYLSYVKSKADFDKMFGDGGLLNKI